MNGLAILFQRRLSNWDNSPWISALWRLALTLVFFRAWDFRFVKSPFRMEDVDPQVLEVAKRAGVNLLDRNLWHTWQGCLFRSLLFLLITALAWWVLSRLRGLFSIRYGATVLPAFLLLTGLYGLAWLLAGGLEYFQGGRIESSFIPTFGTPVWGGWVRSSLYQPPLNTGVLGTLFVLVVGIIEALFFLFHGRMALLEAQQDALRARLSPHFLFNALNTLHAQIEENPASAQETTERLAGLFRQVLEVTEHPTISLKEELAFVEDYLGIERSRMGNRLQVSTAIDEETLDCQVPVLGLQVLVENAIKHGLEPRVEGGEIHISTQLEKGRLRIAVQDPGNGQSRSSNGSGKALANLRARLNRPSDLVLSTIPQGFEAAFTFPQVRG